MKAVVCELFGVPEVLRLCDVPEPSPVAGQIKLRVQATSINPMDVVFRSGELKGRLFSGLMRPNLSILVSDRALGEGVKDLEVGGRVVGITPDMSDGAYEEAEWARVWQSCEQMSVPWTTRSSK